MCEKRACEVRVLQTCSQMGLAWTELHGHRWIRSTLLPAVRAVERLATSQESNILLARAHHLLGDLYCVHDAPIASLRAYRRALRLNRRGGGLLQDIADVLFMVGRYAESAAYEEESRAVHGGDSRDILQISRGSHRRKKPLFVAGDPLWIASENLACGQAASALRLLQNVRGQRAKQIRARAFWALEDAGGVMAEVTRLIRGTGKISWCSTDWFYMPGQLWDEPTFWEAMLTMVPRFSNLGLNSPTSEIQGPPELLSGAPTVPWHRVYRYAIEFHLARTRADAVTLRELLRRFPRWIDCRVALHCLRRTEEPPTQNDLLLEHSKGAEEDKKRRHP
jgi:hypothetical protein